jgi:hypothetical protein
MERGNLIRTTAVGEGLKFSGFGIAGKRTDR